MSVGRPARRAAVLGVKRYVISDTESEDEFAQALRDDAESDHDTPSARKRPRRVIADDEEDTKDGDLEIAEATNQAAEANEENQGDCVTSSQRKAGQTYSLVIPVPDVPRDWPGQVLGPETVAIVVPSPSRRSTRAPSRPTTANQSAPRQLREASNRRTNGTLDSWLNKPARATQTKAASPPPSTPPRTRPSAQASATQPIRSSPRRVSTPIQNKPRTSSLRHEKAADIRNSPIKAALKKPASAKAVPKKRRKVESDESDWMPDGGVLEDDDDDDLLESELDVTSKRARGVLEGDDDDFEDDEKISSDAELAAMVEDDIIDLNDLPKYESKPKKTYAKKSSAVRSTRKVTSYADSAGTLPPISDLSEMFHDMITRKVGEDIPSHVDHAESIPQASGAKRQSTLDDMLKKKPSQTSSSSARGDFEGPKGVYLQQLAEKLGGRKLRVATMCSGTESPLLALDMISRQLKIAFGTVLEVEHVFSCEIEPFKQAYIERNFAPPILFRDVTELGNEFATTAYGAKVKVPGNVDLLVAGTSCVDYSNLNNSKKTIDQKGESGNTFRGMLRWVTNHQPLIVVLENVKGAPWPQVAERFAEVGYSATDTSFDTKDYYIPHTRQRGYLVAFRNPKGGSHHAISSLPTKWVEVVSRMARPASSPLEAFLLPANDSRLHQGRLELAASRGAGKARAPTDWGRCASRHEKCRFEEGLGTKRPWTDWRDGAVASMPEGYWNDWANSQTERVLDLIDCSYLRAAKAGFDASYRTLVWNLSQNVDREIGSAKRPGLAPCLTPTMIPYITNRGGPMIGVEALGLQGIPTDELLLTRETEDQLADLAGNAMSSTVVGACIVAALCLATPWVDPLQTTGDEAAAAAPIKISRIVDSAIAGLGIDNIAQIRGQSQLQDNPLDLSTISSHSLADIISQAALSAKFCLCETNDSVTQHDVLLCSDCGHTRCSGCSDRPFHNFQPHPSSKQRSNPVSFSATLKDFLPMRVYLNGLTTAAGSTPPANVNKDDWSVWSDAVRSVDGAELHFKELERTYQWQRAILRLAFHETKLVYLLWIKPEVTDPLNSRRRKLLAHPVARLIVAAESTSMLEGDWDLRLPSKDESKIVIKGKGELTPTWTARIGLTEVPGEANGRKFAEEKQWTELEIYAPESTKFEVDPSGSYKLHPKCGTAMENLHLRTASKSEDTPRISFFLDPVRTGFKEDDPFLFAFDHERLAFGEERLSLGTLDPSWRPSEAPSSTVKVTLSGKWEKSGHIRLTTAIESSKNDQAVCSMPSGHLELSADLNACKHPTAVLTCRVPLPQAEDDPLWRSVREIWGQIDVEHRGKQAFRALAWITERLPKKLGRLESWQNLETCEMAACQRCAPTPPELTWVERNGRLVAYEDVVQAGEFERALKSRPQAIVAQIKLDDQLGSLQIGLNIASLLHVASAQLPTRKNTLSTLSWRLHTDFRPGTAFFRGQTFSLKSNRPDESAPQPPHFRKFRLRPEQLRSLHWMLAQERPSDVFTFIEEEIAEATLPALGWRVEGRATQPVLVRGGVLADQVGYGKTAISLAVIDVSRDLPPLDVAERTGRVQVKGTIIVVPPHLTGQWEGEISKFLGKRYGVIVLHDINSLNSTTVDDIIEADIVIVSLTLFKTSNYWSNLAAFAANGSLPNGEQATRHFMSRLDEVLAALDEQVETLQRCPSDAHKAVVQNLATVASEKQEAARRKDDFIETFGKKRITGAAYLAMQEEDTGTGKAKKTVKKSKINTAVREDSDPYHLSTKAVRSDWRKMRSPPLHMFKFDRVIIDEFTYVEHRSHAAVVNLEANYTWVLSGTPPITDFSAVKGIANFLGVHLGITDDTEGSAEVVKKRMKGQTAAEAFHSYRETHTAAWHEARYAVAQRFLDTFVRQNIAEIDEIPFREHVISITLPAAERAIYLELEHHISSLQGMTKKIMKSANGSRADRQIRLSDALGNSKDPREALIKRCAHFSMEDETSGIDAVSACQRIVDKRTRQQQLCEADLRWTLNEAIAMYLYIFLEKKGYQDPKNPRERQTSHFLEHLKTTFGPQGNGDADATKRNQELIASEGGSWVKEDFVVNVKTHANSIATRRPREVDDLDGGRLDRKLKLDDIKWQLREKSHVLRKLTIELVSRQRSLRYFTAVRDVQKLGSQSLPPCVVCSGTKKAEMCLLSACGHTGCYDCLYPLAIGGYECPHDGCRVNLELHQLVKVSTLGHEEESGEFGAKLLTLVSLIQSIPKDEKILLFLQFDDLIAKTREALDEADIGSIVIDGSAKRQTQELERFQNLDPRDKKAERVLILNIAASSAAGANLTNANHIIFLHPVHYPEASNYNFQATETQAIGRIRRYGQKRTCHIYRLLTKDSVDETIMKERTGAIPSANFRVGDPLDAGESTESRTDFDMNIVKDDDIKVPTRSSRRTAALRRAESPDMEQESADVLDAARKSEQEKEQNDSQGPVSHRPGKVSRDQDNALDMDVDVDDAFWSDALNLDGCSDAPQKPSVLEQSALPQSDSGKDDKSTVSDDIIDVDLLE